jgi:epsilon-lactone hydrolase
LASEQFLKLREAIRRNAGGGGFGSVAGLRKGLEAGMRPLPAGVTGESVDADGVPCEWQTPDGADLGAVIMYVHGGGYIGGSIATHRNLTGHLARAVGCRVLSVDYRLAPEHPHPAPIEDALTTYRWLLNQGIDSARIAISGDSAGGGLAVAVQLAIRDEGLAMPAASAPISPWVDMSAGGASVTTREELDPMVSGDDLSTIAGIFLGNNGTPSDPLASPLEGDLAGLPPMLIHVGDHEVLLSDSERLADKAAKAGVDVTLEVWPEMIHVWHSLAGMCSEADDAITRMAAFLKPHLALGQPARSLG